METSAAIRKVKKLHPSKGSPRSFLTAWVMCKDRLFINNTVLLSENLFPAGAIHEFYGLGIVFAKHG